MATNSNVDDVEVTNTGSATGITSEDNENDSETEYELTTGKRAAEITGVLQVVTFSARKSYLKQFLQRIFEIRRKSLEDEDSDDEDFIFVCCGCTLRFETITELKEHLERPTAHLFFRCQLCLLTIEALNVCQVVFHASEYHINANGFYPKNVPLELVELGVLGDGITLKEICPECHTSVPCIVAHLWSCNPDDRPLQCPYCYTFIARNACRFNLHVKIHKSVAPFRCPDCAKFFKNTVELHKHLAEVCRHLEQSTRYRCPVCSLVLTTYSLLEKHFFADHNPNKYKCHLCSKEFNICSKKNVHYDKHHLTEFTMSGLRRSKAYTVLHTCEICGEGNLRGFSYERHVRKHLCGPNSKCTVFICKCGFMTMYKGSYLTHRSTPCVNLDFSSLRNSSARLKACNGCGDLKFYTGKERFICETCDKMEETRNPFYKCTLCRKPVRYNMGYVILHLQKKHGMLDVEMPYDFVEKSFYNNNLLDENLIENLNIELIYKCKKCTASFKEKDLLRSHYATVHRKDTGYLHCLECGDAVRSTQLLSIHLQSHGITNTQDHISNDVSDEPQPSTSFSRHDNSDELVCSVCKQKSSNASEHFKHIRSHGMAFLKSLQH